MIARMFAAVAAWLAIAPLTVAGEPPSAPPGRLVLAFTSLRDRPTFSTLHFYEHNGIDQGRITRSIAGVGDTALSHPCLDAAGTICACASKQTGGFAGTVRLWSLESGLELEPPPFNREPGTRMAPALDARGELLLHGGLDVAGGAGGWDLFLFDRTAGGQLELPGVNTDDDEREGAISGDGQWIAFTASHRGSQGLSDIFLLDRAGGVCRELAELNSPARELEACLSHDGRLVAFVSDRPGGLGGKDVYLFDREEETFVPLPGVNSPAHEQSPCLSADGRYLAFVSERTAGAGERDVYLFDRAQGRLLPTPQLNSPQEDFDPCIAWREGSGKD